MTNLTRILGRRRQRIIWHNLFNFLLKLLLLEEEDSRALGRQPQTGFTANLQHSTPTQDAGRNRLCKIFLEFILHKPQRFYCGPIRCHERGRHKRMQPSHPQLQFSVSFALTGNSLSRIRSIPCVHSWLLSNSKHRSIRLSNYAWHISWNETRWRTCSESR